jgi:hypothetical protein
VTPRLTPAQRASLVGGLSHPNGELAGRLHVLASLASAGLAYWAPVFVQRARPVRRATRERPPQAQRAFLTPDGRTLANSIT